MKTTTAEGLQKIAGRDEQLVQLDKLGGGVFEERTQRIGEGDMQREHGTPTRKGTEMRQKRGKQGNQAAELIRPMRGAAGAVEIAVGEV